MEDIDIDPFGEHELRTEEPTDEHIPLDPVTPVTSYPSYQLPQEDHQLGNQTEESKKLHSKENLKELN